MFAAVAGQRQAVRQLESEIASGRLSHAYLFVGEPGLGKTTVARALATALLPEVPLARHPDYWEDDRRGALKLDELRLLPDHAPEFHEQTLMQFLALKPAIAGRRVALITNTGRLADQSQGILLKSIEEPHPGRIIILTTPSVSPFVVLPTVVSRCRRISFHPLPGHELEQLLLGQEVDPERASVLAVLARGRPGWALTAARDPGVVARHGEWEQRLESLFGAPADAALRLAAEVDSANFAWRGTDRAQEDPALLALATWQLLLRRRMASDPVPGRWARLLESSYDTLGYLEQNVSPRLALECFLLECRLAS